ncbi:MAG: glycoside hydrolase family 16 protein, partial [Kiritimatiellaeota bacterium]|nr:glycoside hydrolase family 16 protein [Kiritimatiellota bacterium]
GKARVVVDNIEITRGAQFDDGDLRQRADAKRNKNAAPHIMVDFEADALPATARIAVGEVSAAPANVLLGKRSFVVDTIGRGHEWNEVFGVGRGKLDAGYRYHVTIPVRMDKKGPKGGGVYVAASTPHGEKIGWRSWNSGEGEDDVISTTFAFREDKNYELIIGIQNEARVVFDEIEIRREPLPPDRVPSLKVRDKAKSKLVFEDTFSGGKIDASKWTVTQDRPHRGGMYRTANATLDGNGNLVMEFKPDGDTFSSTCLNGVPRFTFGLFECRMMLPRREGHWPGFWLFNGAVNGVTGDGRDGTEVDIVEAPWRHEDKVTHNLHWDGYGDDHAAAGFTPAIPGINEGWHTFAVDWQPDGYIFLVDGRETWRTDAGGVCQKPLFIILSDELGGWSGNPWNVDKSLFPDKILVDYVRVWQ